MIRKILLCFTLLLISGGLAHAQAPAGNLPAHQATLTWTNPTDPSGTTITGSNAYRCSGTCTMTSGTFAVLNSSPITGSTTYTDKTVAASTTYSYCVTDLVTLSTGSFETACSNIQSATIPPNAASAPSLAAPSVQ